MDQAKINGSAKKTVSVYKMQAGVQCDNPKLLLSETDLWSNKLVNVLSGRKLRISHKRWSMQAVVSA